MIEKDDLYPLIFSPIYKPIVWGGDMLRFHLGRTLPRTDGIPIAESWELSDRPGDESVVENGELQGRSINELINRYGKSLVGELYTPGKRFPLLVKIIDAGKRLSLQVHPDEIYCRSDKSAEPKTEMWYIIAANPNAKIFAGLKPNSTRQQFIENINSMEIENFLQTYNSVPGDAYFISAGRVHAIGAGNLILEIQQNSNTTYRISDWGRIGSDGKQRELHVQQALNSIHFMDRTTPRIPGASDNVFHNRKFPIINRCPYFKVDELKLVESLIDKTDKSSFTLLTALKNPIKICGIDKQISVDLNVGRTALLPSNFGAYRIDVKENVETTVIKTSL